jgi:hypothetical protein
MMIGQGMSKQDYPRKKMEGRSDDHPTDEWLYYGFAFENWFDPCPLFGEEWFGDGLKMEWPDCTYVNPPYRNPMPWVDKALETARKGKRVIMLMKHDSSTKWWSKLHESGARFLPIMGRLKYGQDTGCAFPSVLVVLNTSSGGTLHA